MKFYARNLFFMLFHANLQHPISKNFDMDAFKNKCIVCCIFKIAKNIFLVYTSVTDFTLSASIYRTM